MLHYSEKVWIFHSSGDPISICTSYEDIFTIKNHSLLCLWTCSSLQSFWYVWDNSTRLKKNSFYLFLARSSLLASCSELSFKLEDFNRIKWEGGLTCEQMLSERSIALRSCQRCWSLARCTACFRCRFRAESISWCACSGYSACRKVTGCVK